MAGKKKHMDVFLQEVTKQFISIKESDYKKAQNIFTVVFEQVKQKMCERDNFFMKYATQVLNAGSVYDGIKVGKLDEFDMDIVIRLPINYDDGENGIIIENHKPGFVKMKIINAFDNLDKQPDWEKCHKVTREWRDTDKYFLQNKFRQWMHSIVQKAVNDLDGKVVVRDVTYLLTYKESGPAYTLNVRNDKGGEPFVLDVDLVPVIRLMLPRWPTGYRSPESDQVKEWLVVPKPMKSVNDQNTKNRCWRLAFHAQERAIIKGSDLLKFTIRLMKKLRDTLEMKEIASYYIKTLFLWEVKEKQDVSYWQNKVSVLFTDMVKKLYDAIVAKNIPYYWQENHNLIDSLRPTVQKIYADKLAGVLSRLNANDVDAVVTYLLTPDEFEEFRNSKFCQAFSISNAQLDVSPTSPKPLLLKSNSTKSITVVDGVKEKNSVEDLLKEILASNRRLESKFESINKKLENKIDNLEKKYKEMSAKVDIIIKFIQPAAAGSIVTELTNDLEGLDLSVSSGNELLKSIDTVDSKMDVLKDYEIPKPFVVDIHDTLIQL